MKPSAFDVVLLLGRRQCITASRASRVPFWPPLVLIFHWRVPGTDGMGSLGHGPWVVDHGRQGG